MANPDPHKTSNQRWYEIVTQLYPNALTGTISVPPVHFNNVQYDHCVVPFTGQPAYLVAGLAATPSASQPPPPRPPRRPLPSILPPPQYGLWTQPPQGKLLKTQDSDVRDSAAQEHVMACIQRLGDRTGQVMFILSQVNFVDYLNKDAYSVAAGNLPKPTQRGDFDILIISRRHGVLLGEIKAVGCNQSQLNLSQADADKNVAKRLDKGVRQMVKWEKEVKHLVSDVAPSLTVRTTFFLPYVSSAQLQRVLVDNPRIEEAACDVLGAHDAAEAAQLCCCSDQLSDPETWWDVTSDVFPQLSTWWLLRMNTLDTSLTDQLYLTIVARFVGPATTVSIYCNTPPRVEVRTCADAVTELGKRLSYLVLTPMQLDLIHRSPERVYIYGPPGTGKTIVLVLTGLTWLLLEKNVHVVNTRPANLSISLAIKNQLEMTLKDDPTATQRSRLGKVVLHAYNLDDNEEDVEKAIQDLTSCAQGGELHVLMDETDFHYSNDWGQRTIKLVTDLLFKVPRLYIWATGHERSQYYKVPPELEGVCFTTPLRSAPVVLRQVARAIESFGGDMLKYTDIKVTSPADGMEVIRLVHKGQEGHPARWPVDCEQCGQDVAFELRRLGVGVAGSGVKNSDVFILTRSDQLHDDVRDDAGNVTSQACGMVRGLRGAGLQQVYVLGDHEWDAGHAQGQLTDIAMGRSDKIIAADWSYVSGLERKIVVLVYGRNKCDDEENYTFDDVVNPDILFAASRCTTQLVMVEVPEY